MCALTFTSPLPFPHPPIPRQEFQCPRRPRRSAQIQFRLGRRTPPEIQRLDDETPPPDTRQLSNDSLPPSIKSYLLQKHPSIRKLDAFLTDTSDYPSDGRILSWAFHKYHPPPPWLKPLFKLTALGVTCYLLWYFIRRYSMPVVLVRLVALDAVLTPVLVALSVPMLLYVLLVRSARTDAVCRSLVMHTLSASALMPVAMVASVGNPIAAAVSGIVVRAVHMFGSLWIWRDLRLEILAGTSVVTRSFRVWRMLMTIGVIALGSVVRAMATMGGGEVLELGAKKWRVELGRRFPTMMSLCRDKSGLFCLAFLMLAFAVMYVLYLVVYVIDLGRMWEHRKAGSALSRMMEGVGVYCSGVERGWGISGNEKRYVASEVMLLRPTERVVDSSLVASEMGKMPILQLLEREDEVLEKEGGGTWIPERGSGAGDVLENWARPMSDKDAEMTFEEFFETLDEDEYRYDRESGEWVFEDLVRKGKDKEEEKEEDGGVVVEEATGVFDGDRHSDDEEIRRIAERVLNAKDESELDVEDLERLVKRFGEVDMEKMTGLFGGDAALKRAMEEFEQNDDSGDSIIFV